MLNMQSLSNLGYPWPDVARQSLQRQEQLMLLWLESSIARCLFAEVQEPPDEPAEFRQRLKILVCKLSLHHVFTLYRITI